MADGIIIPTTGSGTATPIVATDDAGAAGHVQVVKLAISTDGSATGIPSDASNGLDVDVTRLPALVAGSALVGKVGLDQTTPGTTNAISLAQLGSTTIDTNSGSKSAGTLRVVLATDQPALTNKLLVTPDANSSINMAQVGGTNTVTAGVSGTQAVGGNVATNVAIGTNPINLGAQAISSENTAVTATRMAQLVTDLVGKLITLPYSNPENFVNGTTAAITDTTSTSVIASQGGSVRTYVTSILVTNSHATVGTFVKILDGSTIIYEGYAAAAGGGFSVSLPVPLRGTAATAVNAQAVTTGANFIVSIAGYKGV